MAAIISATLVGGDSPESSTLPGEKSLGIGWECGLGFFIVGPPYVDPMIVAVHLKGIT
jgi:hypothetical protein